MTKLDLRLPSTLLVLLLFSGCCQCPLNLSESLHRSAMPWGNIDFLSDVVIARVLEAQPIGLEKISTINDGMSIQLFRASIGIESVLQGQLRHSQVFIYYFAESGPQGGPARLGMARYGGTWKEGDRKLFFPQRDSGVLRTSCDYQQYCVIPVLTGAHPEFEELSKRELVQLVVNKVLLTRGEHCTDEMMVEAMTTVPITPFSREQAAIELKKLARDPSSLVRQAAELELKRNEMS